MSEKKALLSTKRIFATCAVSYKDYIKISLETRRIKVDIIIYGPGANSQKEAQKRRHWQR